MNVLTKIVYNCHKATFLIEKKQITSLSVREKLELRIHLAGCDVCRIFQRQSILINRLFKNHFQQEIKLDEVFKKKLQLRVENELNKN